LTGNTATQVALYVDRDRQWSRLMELARIGATERGGVCRLALTEQEMVARRLLIGWAQALDLKIYTDKIANLFFRLDGADSEAPPVVTGSHIDTQPTGGRFDGAYGVVAGFEVIQALKEAEVTPQHPVEVVAWLNEEGSRFSPGMMGSEAFAGRRIMDEILAVTDSDGVRTSEALEQTQANFTDLEHRELGRPIEAYVEAHIEQGPILEDLGVAVGVVSGIQGSRRFRVRVRGEEGHAGTLPMQKRKDALLAATDIIGAMRLAFADEELKFTTGLFEVSPNVPSVVPASVLFSIDLRHPDWTTLRKAGDRVTELCEAHRGPCNAAVIEIATAESLEFPGRIQACISQSAAELKIPTVPILSLAGHDARQLHYHCPTGMIFTACEKGISHNEAENCKPDDLADGTRVLAATVARLADGVRA